MLKRISNDILMKAGLYALNGEPACADHHLPVKQRVMQQNNTQVDDRDNHMARRRADFGFTG